MPVICWKTKKTQTTASARLTPGVHSVLRSSWRSVSAICSAVSRTSLLGDVHARAVPRACCVSA